MTEATAVIIALMSSDPLTGKLMFNHDFNDSLLQGESAYAIAYLSDF